MLELLKRLFGKKKGMRQCNADPPHEENYQPKKEVDKKRGMGKSEIHTDLWHHDKGIGRIGSALYRVHE